MNLNGNISFLEKLKPGGKSLQILSSSFLVLMIAYIVAYKVGGFSLSAMLFNFDFLVHIEILTTIALLAGCLIGALLLGLLIRAFYLKCIVKPTIENLTTLQDNLGSASPSELDFSNSAYQFIGEKEMKIVTEIISQHSTVSTIKFSNAKITLSALKQLKDFLKQRSLFGKPMTSKEITIKDCEIVSTSESVSASKDMLAYKIKEQAILMLKQIVSENPDVTKIVFKAKGGWFTPDLLRDIDNIQGECKKNSDFIKWFITTQDSLNLASINDLKEGLLKEYSEKRFSLPIRSCLVKWFVEKKEWTLVPCYAQEEMHRQSFRTHLIKQFQTHDKNTPSDTSLERYEQLLNAYSTADFTQLEVQEDREDQESSYLLKAMRAVCGKTIDNSRLSDILPIQQFNRIITLARLKQIKEKLGKNKQLPMLKVLSNAINSFEHLTQNDLKKLAGDTDIKQELKLPSEGSTPCLLTWKHVLILLRNPEYQKKKQSSDSEPNFKQYISTPFLEAQNRFYVKSDVEHPLLEGFQTTDTSIPLKKEPEPLKSADPEKEKRRSFNKQYGGGSCSHISEEKKAEYRGKISTLIREKIKKNDGKLTWLYFKRNEFIRENILPLCAALKNNTTVTELSLIRYCGGNSKEVDLKGLKRFLVALLFEENSNSTIKSLDLSHNRIFELKLSEGVDDLGTLFSKLKDMITLKLADTGMTDDQGQALVSGLEENSLSTLGTLDISDNLGIGDKTVDQLVKYLRKPDCKLKHLTINTEIGSENFKKLAGALIDNETLVSLALKTSSDVSHHNQITAEDMKILAEALKSNQTLTTLELGAGVQGRAISELGSMLAKNETLSTLLIRVGDRDFLFIPALLKGLKENISMTSLEIFYRFKKVTQETGSLRQIIEKTGCNAQYQASIASFNTLFKKYLEAASSLPPSPAPEEASFQQAKKYRDKELEGVSIKLQAALKQFKAMFDTFKEAKYQSDLKKCEIKNYLSKTMSEGEFEKAKTVLTPKFFAENKEVRLTFCGALDSISKAQSIFFIYMGMDFSLLKRDDKINIQRKLKVLLENTKNPPGKFGAIGDYLPIDDFNQIITKKRLESAKLQVEAHREQYDLPVEIINALQQLINDFNHLTVSEFNERCKNKAIRKSLGFVDVDDSNSNHVLLLSWPQVFNLVHNERYRECYKQTPKKTMLEWLPKEKQSLLETLNEMNVVNIDPLPTTIEEVNDRPVKQEQEPKITTVVNDSSLFSKSTNNKPENREDPIVDSSASPDSITHSVGRD